MRRSTRRIPLAALATLLLAGVAAPAVAFDLHRHSLMTYQVLGRQGVPGVARSLIAFGAMLPDVQDCVLSCYCDYAPEFCQPDTSEAVPFASHHFDNDRLDESGYFVNDQMAIAQAGVSSAEGDSRASGRALIAFGRALHTTQDFYAHSTFLEINLFIMGRNPANLPRWQGQPYAGFSWSTPDGLTGGGGLQTGYYLATPGGGSYTHDQLNKDNPGSSVHGRIAYQIDSPSMMTTLYGIVSGDFTGSNTFSDAAVAPRHTIFAYNCLFNGGTVFPYIFVAQPTPPVDVERAQRVQEFFAWVQQDPELIAMAEAADSLIAHADADSIGAFPIDAIDADGLPLPLSAAVGGSSPAAPRLLAHARPNPFAATTNIRFLAPISGRVQLRIVDPVGRLIATLHDGEAAAGWHEASWDGCDSRGQRVAPGVYLIAFTGFGHNESQRIARSR